MLASFAERRHKGRRLSIASVTILARCSCSPLTAIFEGSDASGLTPKQAYAAAQSALCLLGMQTIIWRKKGARGS